jgi:hypothetical protein
VPLMALAADEPSAYETLAEAGAGGAVVRRDSDLAGAPAPERRD